MQVQSGGAITGVSSTSVGTGMSGTNDAPTTPANTPKTAASASGSQSSDSGPVAQLKALIAALRKQLAALQLQISRADMSQKMSLQGEATMIESGLQTATAALASLMLQSGQTTGMVDETA